MSIHLRRHIENYPIVLSLDDVVSLTGCTLREVRRLVRTGALPARKTGRQWRVSREDMIEFLEQRVFSIGWPVDPLKTSPVFRAFMAAASRKSANLTFPL